jgi:DNA-binding NarL/FixJ family response regulator
MTKNYSILHLDDNPIIANMVKPSFDTIPTISYSSTYNIKQTEERLQEKLPEILIVDLMLDNDYDPTPGIQYIKKAHQQYPGLRMIVYTGYKETGLKKELAPYIVHYEQKGGNPVALVNKIQSLLWENE